MTWFSCWFCSDKECANYGKWQKTKGCERFRISAAKPDQEDGVNHPEHYTFGGMECFDGMEAQMTPEEYRGYLRGCVVKYMWRFRHKGGVKDLEKARAYLDRLIEKVKADGSED